MPKKERKKQKKRKIIILGLIGFVTILAVCLGIFAHRGTAPFEISKVYGLSLSEGEKVDARYIAAVDLFGDGREEVLMSYDVYSVEKQMVEGGLNVTNHYEQAKLLALSSNATGDFQKLWEYDSGLTRQAAATGDFDGDGKLDIVVGGYKIENEEEFPASAVSEVEVLLQKDGSFEKVFSANIPKFLPGSIVTGDFDGDGRTDFVVSGLALENESPYQAYLFDNEGGDNFTMSPIALKKGMVAENMWKADINSDGSPDLVIQAIELASGNHSLILLLNNGGDEFEFRELDVPVYSMVMNDFTGDGYPDIIYAATDQFGDDVYFLRNEQGEFAAPSPIDVQGGGGWLDTMIAGDFSNDGALEAALLERSAASVGNSGSVQTSLIAHLFLIKQSANGGLSFISEWSKKLLEENGLSAQYAAVAADTNDDGKTDLVIVSWDGSVYLVSNQHA